MIAAKKFVAPGKRKMHFAVSDANSFSAELNNLGLSYVNDTPVVVAHDLSERRYVMQQPLTYVLVAYIYVFPFIIAHRISNPTIRLPGFNLGRSTWSMLNHFCTVHGCCAANLHKWHMASSDRC